MVDSGSQTSICKKARAIIASVIPINTSFVADFMIGSFIVLFN